MPLYKAVTKRGVECIKILLPYTADINATTSLGHTATHFAIALGRRRVLKILPKRGASVTIGDIDGRLPVHLAALSSRAREKYRVKALRCLLDKYPHLVDAPTEGPNNDRRTTLHMAAANGQLLVVKCLLEYGVNLETLNTNERTALHYAADYNQEQALILLLNKGANAMAADCNGWLPIHIACQKHNAPLVKTLATRCPESVNALIAQSDRSKTPLHVAAENGNVECIEALLNNGADATIADQDGRLALHWASASGYSQCVRILCKRHPDKMNWKSALRDGQRTALHLAIANNHYSVVAALLECGANASEHMDDGRTALHLLHSAIIDATDVHNASAIIKAMLQKAQRQSACVNDTVARIMQMNEERKAKALNEERITQGVFLNADQYDAMHAGIWHLPDVESDELMSSVCLIQFCIFVSTKEMSPPERKQSKSGSVA